MYGFNVGVGCSIVGVGGVDRVAREGRGGGDIVARDASTDTCNEFIANLLLRGSRSPTKDISICGADELLWLNWLGKHKVRQKKMRSISCSMCVIQESPNVSGGFRNV